jgi:hypothetical protein
MTNEITNGWIVGKHRFVPLGQESGPVVEARDHLAAQSVHERLEGTV